VRETREPISTCRDNTVTQAFASEIFDFLIFALDAATAKQARQARQARSGTHETEQLGSM